MKVNAITLRKGNVIEHNDKLWVILQADILQPGKGAAVVQISMRDLRSGTKSDERFRTQETVERVYIEETDFQFLFGEGDAFTFMNNETFDQIEIGRDIIGDPAQFLQEGMVCQVELYEGQAISVTLPDSVTLTIAEADPVVKGQTASSSYKPAILENGVRVMVPPHIQSGTRIVVKTADGSYVERAKD